MYSFYFLHTLFFERYFISFLSDVCTMNMMCSFAAEVALSIRWVFPDVNLKNWQ